MKSIKDQLDILEQRLQTLIEESPTQILPFRDKRADISARMVSAMQSNIRLDESGDLVAPDLYILAVDPQTARLLAEKKSITIELSENIHQAGNESQVKFQSPPRIKINSDHTLEKGALQIAAQFSLPPNDKTRTIAIDIREGNPVPAHAFLITNGVQIFPLTHQVINIGRRIDNHLVIEDRRVSRVHAQIRAINGRYTIFDLDSSGGTFVNGVRSAQAILSPGDVISLAGVDLVYGQDAALLSSDDLDATQPLVPFPDSET